MNEKMDEWQPQKRKEMVWKLVPSGSDKLACEGVILLGRAQRK